MRAGVFRGKGRIEVEDVPDPVAGAGDVVLDGHGCGGCGFDAGGRLGGARYGQVMGHEFAGRVVEVGARVEGIAEGDLLTGLPIQPCGDCRRCRAGPRRPGWRRCRSPRCGSGPRRCAGSKVWACAASGL